MGSKLGTFTIQGTWKVEKPYGTHLRHGSQDILTFGPNLFNCNLTSRSRPDGLETRYLNNPKSVEGGEAIRNPSEARIPRYPYFWPELV